MRFQKAARALKGAPEFPLNDYTYTRDGVLVNVTIDPSSFRQKFSLNPKSDASDFEKTLPASFGCEVWNIVEKHAAPGKAPRTETKKKFKFNASINVANAADVALCLQYFINPTHRIFTADPYGTGVLTHTTNQGQVFRYHADRHHGLASPTDLNFSEEERGQVLRIKKAPKYHSLGLSVNSLPDPTGKYGNIEIKFKQGEYKIILNLHLQDTAVLALPTTTREEALEKIATFRSIVHYIKSSLNTFFEDKDSGDIKLMGIFRTPGPEAPPTPPVVDRIKQTKDAFTFKDFAKGSNPFDLLDCDF